MIKNYSFDFDGLNILGGYKDRVHVQGILMEYDEDDDTIDTIWEDIILSINRNMFKYMLDKWLDEKINYCERWNGYCGVLGRINCDVEKDYETWLNIYPDDPDEQPTKKDITVYKVLSFDEYIDMEHG